ncbi:MAG: C39 family peptidase [Verrucomicrobiales bacterium]|nr:C39 family peptidase [Verrucomicrobiales bacterium]
MVGNSLRFLFLFLISPAFLHAIPNSFFGNGTFFGPVIPAQPVFGRDLTVEFFAPENWENGVFPGPWVNQAALEGQSIRKMSANPTLFGAVPMSVYSYQSRDEKTDELAIHFLDAGLFFGYQFGGEQNREDRARGAEKRAEFSKLYRNFSRELRDRLDRGCGRGIQGTIGRSDELRTVFTQYQWEDFIIRLVTRPGHSVSIHILREGSVPNRFYALHLSELSEREKEEYFAAKVSAEENGDKVINDIPMFTQGNTPFCGIHSLAMAGHYLGLRVHPETLAAGAEFKNTGSAKGSQILDLYRGIGDEIGMKVRVSPKFSPSKARKSIEDGIPLVVWRRVSKEREQAHNQFQQAFLQNPGLQIDPPDSETLSEYPRRDAKGSPSHASVITGINVERQEIIFTEPWGEFSRNRRMRFEEMEATAYAVFTFSLRN